MHTTKKQWITYLVSLIALLWVTNPCLAAEKEKPVVKVAVVNGSVITQDDVDREMNNVRSQFARRGRPLNDAQIPEMTQRVTNSLIDRELLYQDSKKQGIEIKASVIDEQYEKIKKQFPDEEKFKEAIKRMNFDTEAEAKEDLRKRLAVKELIDEKIVPKVTVSDEELKTFYDNNRQSFTMVEQVRASHILTKVESKADESKKAEARKKIMEVQQKLKDGGDFSELAKKYSEGPSASRGGDLGYFVRGKMVKPFEEAAFSLKKGEVSDIVETRFGYHLIKVTDKKPQGIQSFESQKENISRFLRQMSLQQLLSEYTAKLREKAKIEMSSTESPK